MIRFACPTCRTVITHDQAGAKLPCPRCGQRVQVPRPAAPAVAAAARPPAASVQVPLPAAATVAPPEPAPREPIVVEQSQENRASPHRRRIVVGLVIGGFVLSLLVGLLVVGFDVSTSAALVKVLVVWGTAFFVFAFLVGAVALATSERKRRRRREANALQAAAASRNAYVENCRQLCQKAIVDGEGRAFATGELQALYHALNQLHGIIEVGGSFDQFRGALAVVIPIANEFARYADHFPTMAYFVEEIVQAYKHVNSLNQHIMASHSTRRAPAYVGGGYGIEGALKGIALAEVLNWMNDNSGDVDRQVAELKRARDVCFEKAALCFECIRMVQP